METAFLIVALLVVVLAGTASADRLRFPAPLLLIAIGVALAYLPFLPEVRLHPEVVLLGFLPPLLHAAAIQTSLVDFAANRRPILLLSFGLVGFTAAGVGVVVHALLPGCGWPAAFALGAVVAPPDAVSATAIARRIGLPRRIVTILEGESLLNDATALVALRTAIAAAAGGVTVLQVGTDFVRATGGGVACGLLVFLIVAAVRRRVTDPLLDTAVSFVTPFAAYLAAERIHASGVLAVVVAGLLLGHKAPIIQTAQSRLAERMNWRTVAYLLENTVFLLIGLQARWIIEEVSESSLTPARVALVCVATLAAVVALRIAWVFASRLLLVRPGPDPTTAPPPLSSTFIISWAGMRGVVTLAAAFVIPTSVDHREVMLLVAFTVVAGTLYGQGLTLPWLVRRLRIPLPDPTVDALARAELLQQASVAGLQRLGELEDEGQLGVTEMIRQRVDQRNFAAWERLATTPGQEPPSVGYSRIRRAMIDAERERVLQVRSGGRMPSEVVSEVLTMLDVEETMLEATTESYAESTGRQPDGAPDRCADLERFPARADATAIECADCLVAGTSWVALRRCLICDSVGCCDSSVGRHAAAHFEQTGHPVMQSAEEAESWRWCYRHHLTG